MAGKWEKHAAALREKRRQLLEQLGEGPSREHGLGMRDSVAELSFADNHPADLGTENFERSKDLSLRELHFSQLRQVEEALARISAGTYGICSRCARRSPRPGLKRFRKRLSAYPAANTKSGPPPKPAGAQLKRSCCAGPLPVPPSSATRDLTAKISGRKRRGTTSARGYMMMPLKTRRPA